MLPSRANGSRKSSRSPIRSREYEREYVGTEHVLMAVQREGTGTGASILAKHGITGPKLKAQVDQLIKKQLEETWVFGRLPGTPPRT